MRKQKNEIPFILFTGKGREEVAIRALNLGADGYINKQGSPETVYGELAHRIQKSFEYKNANELLRKSRAELNAIVYNAPLGIATSDSNMLFRSANEAFCRIVGYSEEELQKRSFIDITCPDDVEVSKRDMKELICGSIPYFSQEKRYVRKDGRIIDGKVTVSTIRNNEGKPVLFVAELEDITQSKQAEAELRRTFNILERVGEGIDAGLAVINKDYRIVWSNRRLMDLGVAPNKKCYETFNNIGVVCPNCGVEKIFKNNAQLDVHEFKTVNSKGETTWIELRVTPLKDPNGVTIAALELAIPITERKQVEAALNESEARFREAFATAPDAFYISTLKEGKMIEVNEHFEKMFGYTRKEIIGKTSFQLGIWANPIDREKMLTQLKAEVKARNLEMHLVRKNGQVFPAQFSVSVLQSGNEQRLVGVIRDASNEKQAQEALKRSEKEYSSLFANMIDGFAYCKMINDENGKPVDFIYLQINDAFERITGLEREMVLGKKGN